MLLAGMKLARGCCTSPELAQYFDGEHLPGTQRSRDDELLDYARRYGSTAYHLIGTARMGPASDPTAVVDDELRVHGLEGLRVVDASIMPNMPSANTYASTMMIAEKASDMIRGRAPLAPVEGVRRRNAPPSALRGPTLGRLQEHRTLHRLPRSGGRGQRRRHAATAAAGQGRARHRQDHAGARGRRRRSAIR